MGATEFDIEIGIMSGHIGTMLARQHASCDLIPHCGQVLCRKCGFCMSSSLCSAFQPIPLLRAPFVSLQTRLADCPHFQPCGLQPPVRLILPEK